MRMVEEGIQQQHKMKNSITNMFTCYNLFIISLSGVGSRTSNLMNVGSIPGEFD